MSKEKASEFIEKLFSDDAFVEEAVRKIGGVPKNNKDESNESFVKMGHAMGYDFTGEELTPAIEEYAQGKGFAGFRRLIHVGRLMMKVSKKL